MVVMLRVTAEADPLAARPRLCAFRSLRPIDDGDTANAGGSGGGLHVAGDGLVCRHGPKGIRWSWKSASLFDLIASS